MSAKGKRGRSSSSHLRMLIVPDTHAPFERVDAFELMLKAMTKEWKPEIVVVLGDFFDFHSLSAHPPENDRQEDFEAELLGGRARLSQLVDFGDARRVFIAGNHEQRLERYLAKNAPKLYRRIRLPHLLGLNEGPASRHWEYVPYKQTIKIGQVHYTHDTGRSGKFAASQSREDFESNAVIGHCHRLQYFITGCAQGIPHVGASFGWLGNPDKADYMHAIKAKRDWATGFGVGLLDEKTGITYLQPVPVIGSGPSASVMVGGKIITGGGK